MKAPMPDRRTTNRRISPAIGEFAIQENVRLREELLQCRSKLALAAESAAGDDELIAELLAALRDMEGEIHNLVQDGTLPEDALNLQTLIKCRAAIAKAQPSQSSLTLG